MNLKNMTALAAGNFLRSHRRRSGLSQRELGLLVGYPRRGQVSRHERSKSIPPLLVALAYETVFQVPVANLFAGFHAVAANAVRGNLKELKSNLERNADKRKVVMQKLQWLTEQHAL